MVEKRHPNPRRSCNRNRDLGSCGHSVTPTRSPLGVMRKKLPKLGPLPAEFLRVIWSSVERGYNPFSSSSSASRPG